MRIVSLCPSLTELVFDLGRGEELVGITKYCVHPADRVGALEKVGGTKNPKIERILELAPDLVLMNQEENRVEDAEALQAAGIELHSSMPRQVKETAAMVRSIGKALERSEEAERIARDIEERARRVRHESAGRETVTWAYLIWRKPLMTVNGDTFVSALLSLAGGRNVFADRSARYPEIGSAELSSADPQRVFLGSEPFPFEQQHRIALAEETGLPLERFVLADGQYLSWHGSRTPDGIDYAARLIEAGR
jgi:ABC-type Fe3+-hydroxamate transport system substrate-binding protein